MTSGSELGDVYREKIEQIKVEEVNKSSIGIVVLISISDAKKLSQGDELPHAFTVQLDSADSNWLTGYTLTKRAPPSTTTKP